MALACPAVEGDSPAGRWLPFDPLDRLLPSEVNESMDLPNSYRDDVE